MSTTAAARSLFAGLIDDAAVFPPGNAPVARAWAEHLDLHRGAYAELLGPLLLGTSDVDALVTLARASRPPEHLSPVAVRVVGRAGTAASEVVAAVRRLQDVPGLVVRGAEVVHDVDGRWRQVVGEASPVAVEVPREGADLISALDDLAEVAAGRADGTDAGDVSASPPVVAKLRTQATQEVPAPTARQLAEFLTAVGDRGLPFKLTGGLHHAAAHGNPEDGSFEQGFLNVVVAAHHLVQGVGLASLTATLQVGEAEALAALAGGLTEQEALDLRSRFVSFGCCGVMDPISALVRLGLLHPSLSEA